MSKRNRNNYSSQVNDAVGDNKRTMFTTPENDNKSKAMAERMKALESNALTISLTNKRLLKQNQKLNAQNQKLNTNNFQLTQQIINLNNRISAMQAQIEILKQYNDDYTLEIGKLNRAIGILRNGSGHNTGSGGMEVDNYKKIIKW